MSGRVEFTCNGRPAAVDVEPDESLLSVLRERLGLVSAKDGCAPQGQCGCCTVLVDGAPRVACVTPAARVAGREVTTIEGLDFEIRARWGEAFVATGGSQCGFCTPGIVLRGVGLVARGRTARADLDRGLAAHLCRCTGWRTVYEAIETAAAGAASDVTPARRAGRGLGAAPARAALEGGVSQRVDPEVPLGGGGFADDLAPRDALVAVPRPSGSATESIDAAGCAWVVDESLVAARAKAGKVQGRRSTLSARPPLWSRLPERPSGGVRLATSWVEPAYLEPDASWCEPGGEPATPLANGGAFGGKTTSLAPEAARELADHLGRTVRVVLSREDVVRMGPKRPPIAASAALHGGTVIIGGCVAREPLALPLLTWPYVLGIESHVEAVEVAGPPVGHDLRAEVAEHVVLVEGALAEAGVDRAALLRDERAASVALDACAPAESGAVAGAHVAIAPDTGALERVEVRVAAGDPLDDVVLRSYAIGATHMALGWVLTEGLTVDPDTGEVHDLTIRSFGIIRAKDTPPIDVTIVDDAGPPLARSSDAVFSAVAAATWNAVTAADGARPEGFPARETRAARRLRG